MSEGGVTRNRMTKFLFPVTLLHLLLHDALCQHMEITKQEIAQRIYDSLITPNTEALKPYSSELFKPLDGPFFRPLWELFPPYNAFAVLGFPPVNESGTEITVPMFRVNQTLALYDKGRNGTFLYKVAENTTLLETILAVLELIENDMYSHVISPQDCGVMNLSTPFDRMRYQEVVRPRYYLPTVVDIYRILLKSSEVCTATEGSSADCFPILHDYVHALWMYNWVACYLIGSDEAYDVDGICPKLCRPHTIEVMSGSHDTSHSVPLIYHKMASEDAIDVCEQLVHAVSGSCELLNGNRSVHMDEFRCQCISPAYEWTQAGNYRGCLLKREILESNDVANDTNPHVKCPLEESDCDAEGTEFCYYRIQRNNTTGEIVPSESVLISFQPYCHCRKGYAGHRCSETLNPCEHPIEDAITDEENYLYNHIPDGPDMPMFYKNESAKASGNWLCGTISRRGKCGLNSASEGGFECTCSKGYTRDWNYSKYDNCMKDTTSENATEIDGRQVVVCGTSFCLNNGTCVVKPTHPTTIGSNLTVEEMELDELDVTRVCQCAARFFGPSCDVVESAWSAWDPWSPCVPSCGQFRYQYRMRSCIGDAGCIGSALESAPCPQTPCPLLDAVETKSSQREGHRGQEGRYYNVSSGSLLIWMLGFMVPLEILLIFIGVVVLEKCILRRR